MAVNTRSDNRQNLSEPWPAVGPPGLAEGSPSRYLLDDWNPSVRIANMKMRIPTPHQHFGQLREKIHDRLWVLRPPHWEEQIEKHPWLYGALGHPEAGVMFICEDPSLKGVREARSPLGGPCDFDTQWTGDPAYRRASGSVLCCATSG